MFSDNLSAENSKLSAEFELQLLQLLECMGGVDVPKPLKHRQDWFAHLSPLGIRQLRDISSLAAFFAPNFGSFCWNSISPPPPSISPLLLAATQCCSFHFLSASHPHRPLSPLSGLNHQFSTFNLWPFSFYFMSPPPVMTTGWPPWPQHPLTRSPTWQGSTDSHNNLTWLNWVLSYTHIWDAPGFWTFTFFFCQTSLAHPAWIGHKLGKGAARRLMPSLHCSDEGLKMCCIWKPKSWIFTRPSLFSKLDVRPFKGYTIDNLILLFILHSFQTYQLLLGAKYCPSQNTQHSSLLPIGQCSLPNIFSGK